MGVDPVTGIVSLTIATGLAFALYIEECKREEERRRQQEEDRRRWRKEEEKREREARRERLREERERRKKMEREERQRREKMERVERERRERMKREERRRRQEEAEEINYLYDPFQTLGEYRRSQPFHTTNQRVYSFQSYSYDTEAENRNCVCWPCTLRRARNPPGAADFYETFSSEFDPFQTSEEYYRSQPFRTSYRYDNRAENRNCVCRSCTGGSPLRAVSPPRAVSPSRDYDPFSSQFGSVTLTITQTQTAPNKNQNVKNKGSSNRPTSSSSKDATSSTSTSKQNTNAPKNPSSGSDQSQRNNNNNNNNNNSDKKDTVQDYGNLNDFMEILKSILDRCKVSKELRKKILAFFNKFEKHEENFLGLLEDFRIQNIAIEDIVSIVVRLFQSDYFAEYVAYPNFLALMEIVAKYLKDELIIEMIEDSIRGSKKSHEQQREECMKKVLQRENILSEITALFEKARKEIVEDNDRKPLNPDFSGIFAKVYHYIKHRDVRGEEWTVTKYFDWVRKLLVLLKNLTPEYGELSNVNHPRRQIVFEMYSTAYQGYFRIVVRAYGPNIKICTFFLREKRDKKAKDGDKFVDGKKKS